MDETDDMVKVILTCFSQLPQAVAVVIYLPMKVSFVHEAVSFFHSRPKVLDAYNDNRATAPKLNVNESEAK